MTLVNVKHGSAIALACLAALGWPQMTSAQTASIADSNGCRAANPYPKPGETITWSGLCPGGWAKGEGTLRWFLDGKSNGTFTGTFHEGKATGKLVVEYANGLRYEGAMADFKRHGAGVLVLPSGVRYEGQWINDELPHGALNLPNGNRYQGDLARWRENGRGTFSWVNGDRYEGAFLDGKMHGRGALSWSNGERYEGEFVAGNMQGQGILTQANGDRYDGAFIAGKLAGRTLLTRADGTRIAGTSTGGSFAADREPGEKRDAATRDEERPPPDSIGPCAPPAGKALLYVYRRDAFPASRMDAIFRVNGIDVATLGANSYTCFYLAEGGYRLEQRWNLERLANAPMHRDFIARAGATYFFRLKVEPGMRELMWSLGSARPPEATPEISQSRFQSAAAESPAVQPSEIPDR